MDYPFAIHPVVYTEFESEDEQIERCKEWGLLSDKAVKMKAFHYKRDGLSLPCSIVGYADKITAVLQFENGQLHSIHPSYLKEMQAANYGVKAAAAEPEAEQGDSAPAATEPSSAGSQATAELGNAGSQGAANTTAPEAAVNASDSATPVAAPASVAADASPEAPASDAPAPKKGKAKKEKLVLPEEKVKMTATVQEFTTVPNHFTDEDDEVVIYEAVAIAEPALELGTAWSSHSNTLKKQELNVGDTITFEAKVVAKKLTKHPVPYKINNPAKIQKQ